MSLNMQEYEKIKNVYSKNKHSFQERIDNVNLDTFTSVNWSDTFLDFSGYESIFNQLKKIKTYDEEKESTIKNYFLDNKLVYSVNNENYKWGSAFIDYDSGCHIWLLFVENIDDEMILRQLRIKYFDNNKVVKSSFYLYDDDYEDDIEETFMSDDYEYDSNNNLIRITRNGFYQNVEKILPPRIFSFEYEGKKMKIFSTQNKFEGDPAPTSIIYEGKIVKPII